MTVPSTKNVKTHVGNGVTTVFPFDFRIFEAEDLEVSLTLADGTIEDWVLGTDFTVPTKWEDVQAGGEIIATTAPASGTTLVIKRVLDLLQKTDLRNQGDFLAEVIEDQFDRLVMQDQQISEVQSRTLQRPLSGGGWDAEGRPIKNVGAPVDPSDAARKTDVDTFVSDVIQPLVDETRGYRDQSQTAAGQAAGSATSAGNSLNSFLDRYWGPYATDPTVSPIGNPPDEGDLYWNTTAKQWRVWNGSAWQQPDTAVPVNYDRRDYIATASQTTFAVDYDAPFVQVWVNGALIPPSDYTATSGTSVVLAEGVPADTEVTVIGLGATTIDVLDGDAAQVSTSTGTQLLPAALDARVVHVPDIAALRALTVVQDGQVVIDGSTGDEFVYIAGDQSANVADNPHDWQVLDSDPAATSGALRNRSFSAPVISGTIPASSNGTKMLVRIAQYPAGIGTVPSRVYLVSSGVGGREYLLYELRRGAVTANGSLGGDAEFLRVTSVFKQSVAWVGRHVYSAVSAPSDWTETQYTPAGTTTKFVGAALEAVDKYWALSSGVGGEYIEFNVPFNDQREANIQFYSTPASATDVEITIDGGPAEVVDISAATAGIYRHKLTATPGFHTVRITAPTASNPVNVFGSNYEDVSDSGRFSYIEGFVTWGGNGKYTSGEGASDYAILDDDSGLFGGSLHGGETLLEETYIVDGVDTSVMAAPIIGRNIQIEQSTSIDWSVSGGGTMGVRSSHNFDRDGGYSIDAVFSGDVRSGTFYCAMHTTPESFGEIIFPVVRDISGEADGFKAITRTDTIVQQDGVTKNKIYNKTLLVDDRGNIYGGPTIRKVSGSYNKFYYGPAISGDVQRFTALTSVTEKAFM